jgi:DNA-binding LacI/PurR family transcriptional regulator
MCVFYRRRLGVKIIFLDLDGVLVNRAALRARRLDPQHKPAADPEAVAALNHIVESTGAQIVVTSTWREEYSLAELRELLARWGVSGFVVDVTPMGNARGQEIQEWLTLHAAEHFVILDDQSDMERLQAHLVKTETEAGLTMREAEMAIAHLNPPQ